MTLPRQARPAALSASVLAVTLALLVCAHTRWPDAQHLKVATGLVWLAASAAVPLVRRRGSRATVARHTLAAAAWGAGTTAAGLFPHAALGPLPFPPVVQALSLLPVAAVVVQQLRTARVGDHARSPLVEAVFLATVLAGIGWDGYARAGFTGDAGWAAGTVLVLVTASLVAAATTVLAVEQPRLRLCGIGLAIGAVGTEVSAVVSAEQPVTGDVGTALGLLGALVLVVRGPRTRLVRHGGAAAARAVRRQRVAGAVPAGLVLADVALFAVSPRDDVLMLVFLGGTVVGAALRQAVTARAVDRTSDRLSFQALHDPLTGLQNRTALRDALTEPDRVQSLVLLEVTGLDDVTDVLGVAVGEEVLRAAAANLREHVTPLGGSTYRVRHDEFALLLPGAPDKVARHLPGVLDAVSAAPLQVPGAGRFPVDALAGLSRVDPGTPTDGGATLPLVHADLALRDARTNPRGQGYSVFSGEVAAQHARRLKVRERLAAAVADGAVDVHFQPIVDLTTGRVVKFEALARWDDAELGRVSPVEFVPVAEESNLVVALGEHVLRTAVDRAHAAGVFDAGVRLAVNVSVVQLQSPGFADVVRQILSTYRIAPELLTLELTESVFLDSDSPAERVVTELARLGCQIAIDDFGTGYSAFGYLDRLPVHVLKIDRSLTQSLTTGGNGRSVVTAVVDLANRLGLTVVVEGVETDEEAAICRSMQAGLGQGWLYSAAVTADRVAEELQREHPVSGGVW
ncbi:putative bifunctional diguanylate cyclase/phosphodiesterase [Kineococcus aurantiacus]|uniref:EAL domain-containing protein (Putative c-di-GMP-specific phosphodiesterase class I)/GGDEF domain-containing protein n=1 Tax=Kineococcus aurantiacus TaxID=37633 RepID=A0A7Y9DKP0_9ACTN|nr:bifunctional diguanylate cyclase/phosphodiesterase [Kineococcus aurantiacus]NYD22335.1 EAL domain-containing protein (putative c-di-GMP-specific phosphodiesterase class I)/GGDEF domain-containing protein [Kineococcus aurantiacus]